MGPFCCESHSDTRAPQFSNSRNAREFLEPDVEDIATTLATCVPNPGEGRPTCHTLLYAPYAAAEDLTPDLVIAKLAAKQGWTVGSFAEWEADTDIEVAGFADRESMAAYVLAHPNETQLAVNFGRVGELYTEGFGFDPYSPFITPDVASADVRGAASVSRAAASDTLLSCSRPTRRAGP